jgi:hypothetical protein
MGTVSYYLSKNREAIMAEPAITFVSLEEELVIQMKSGCNCRAVPLLEERLPQMMRQFQRVEKPF